MQFKYAFASESLNVLLCGWTLGAKKLSLRAGLFSSLGYLLSNNGINAQDYQLALQKYMKREAGVFNFYLLPTM